MQYLMKNLMPDYQIFNFLNYALKMFYIRICYGTNTYLTPSLASVAFFITLQFIILCNSKTIGNIKTHNHSVLVVV